MDFRFLALPLLLSACVSAALQADPVEATKSICRVLDNVFKLIVYTAAGAGLIAFIPCLIAAAVIFLVVKKEDKHYKALRIIAVIVALTVPVLFTLTLTAIFAIKIIFTGGKC